MPIAQHDNAQERSLLAERVRAHARAQHALYEDLGETPHEDASTHTGFNARLVRACLIAAIVGFFGVFVGIGATVSRSEGAWIGIAGAIVLATTVGLLLAAVEDGRVDARVTEHVRREALLRGRRTGREPGERSDRPPTSQAASASVRLFARAR
jgi:hypothetical protein